MIELEKVIKNNILNPHTKLKRLYNYMKSIEHSLYDSELECLSIKQATALMIYLIITEE